MNTTLSRYTAAFSRERHQLQEGERMLAARVARIESLRGSGSLDDELITNGEYQVFIRDEIQRGIFRQPDHWSEPLCPRGELEEPVLGVRFSDALAFCEWLSAKVQNSSRPFSTSRIKSHAVRLPTREELHKRSTSRRSAPVLWCTDGQKPFIWDIDGHLEHQGTKMTQIFREILDFDLSRDFDLTLHRRLDRNRDRDSALERARNRDRNSKQQVKFRLRTISVPDVLSVDIDRYIVVADDLKRYLSRAVQYIADLRQFVSLARDLDRAIREADTVELLRAYLLCIAFVWCVVNEQLADFARHTHSVNKSELDRLLGETRSSEEGAFSLYAYFLLIEARRSGQVPPIEGVLGFIE